MLIDELVMKPEVNQRLLSAKGDWLWTKKKPKRAYKKHNRGHKKNKKGFTEMQQQIVDFVRFSGDCKGKDIAKHIGYSPYNIVRLLKPLIANGHIKKIEKYKVYYCGDTPPKNIKNKPVHTHCIERAEELGVFGVEDFKNISKAPRYHVFAMEKEGYIKKVDNQGELCHRWEWIG